MNYALVSAARNEAAFIEQTIQSVINQTVRPVRWIIVSDGSTDATDDIVMRYAERFDWINLLRNNGDKQRNFGSKAKAVMAGYAQLSQIQFDCIGNLDVDITFEPTYYEGILAKMAENPRLGLAGGIRYDLCNGAFKRVYAAQNSVGGPFQLFRADCFAQIGGYMNLSCGGIDAVAETSARMYGWEVRSFETFVVHHHRCTGTANRTRLEASFRAGQRDYLIGYHPLFELARCFRRISRFRSVRYYLYLLAGYFWSAVQRKERPVSQQFVKFLQREQLARLGLR